MTLLNDELKGRIASEVAVVTRLETKLTLLVGFAVTAIPLLLSRQLELITGIGALIALTCALCLSLDGLRPRTWVAVPEPRAFIGELGDSPRIEILGALIGTRVEAFEHNKQVSKVKRRRWQQALVIIAISAALGGTSIQLGKSAEKDGADRSSDCKVKSSVGGLRHVYVRVHMPPL